MKSLQVILNELVVSDTEDNDGSLEMLFSPIQLTKGTKIYKLQVEE